MSLAWGITDGSAGMIAQVRALAQTLNMPIEIKQVRMHKPWIWLPASAYALLLKHLPISWIFSQFPNANDTAPNLIISCGRKAAIASLMLQTKYHEKTHYLCIQDPRVDASHFDVVIAMAHDRITGANVIKTPFALHTITPALLEKELQKWSEHFMHLPRPWTAFLIGGSTNRYRFDNHAYDAVIARIKFALEREGGSVLITTSRRTGTNYTARLQHRFDHHPRAMIYAGEGENPYLGFLACADRIVVTNDSVNMMSEAFASGKPVSILKLPGHRNTKPSRFANHITEVTTSPQEMMGQLAGSVRQMLSEQT